MADTIASDRYKELELSLRKQAADDGIQKLVVGSAVIREGAVLILKRAKDEFMAGLQEFPGGGVNEGETLVEAVIREVLEETGLKVALVEGYIGHFDYLSGSGRRARLFNFAVRPEAGDVKLNPAEHSGFFWLKEADIASWRGNDKAREILTAYFKKQ